MKSKDIRTVRALLAGGVGCLILAGISCCCKFNGLDGYCFLFAAIFFTIALMKVRTASYDDRVNSRRLKRMRRDFMDDDDYFNNN